MNNFFRKIKNIFYALPFGLKAADNEIIGSGKRHDDNGMVIDNQMSDERVSKHLLKGEVTQEVEELRYRTYKVERESNKYNYVGNGIAVKEQEDYKKKKVIKFSQENKLICNDILTELKRVNGYGIEKYTVNIDYYGIVKLKMEEFLTLVDVYIEDGKNAVTTLHFSDIMNPDSFRSKPFVNELSKLHDAFNKHDSYGAKRCDFASLLSGLSFTTFNATDKEPNIISYTFIMPELISVQHENGEYKLVYEWDDYSRIDLTEKFFNYNLEKKYNNKEKKQIRVETEIVDTNNIDFFKLRHNKIEKCGYCNKDINIFFDGFMTDKEGKIICPECYAKYLLNND